MSAASAARRKSRRFSRGDASALNTDDPQTSTVAPLAMQAPMLFDLHAAVHLDVRRHAARVEHLAQPSSFFIVDGISFWPPQPGLISSA